MATDNHRPLEGKRVVVTRAAEQAKDFVAELERLGAEVMVMPMVSSADPEDCLPLDGALRALASFDWIVFTSQNAVRYFAKRCGALGIERIAPSTTKAKVAAVGPATAQAAQQEGIRVDFTAGRFRGTALAEELGVKVSGKRILIPRSDRAGNELPAALRAVGAEVSDVIAYRTLAPAATNGELWARGMLETDVIAFASPSAFHHFAESQGIELLQDRMHSPRSHTKLAAIGPTTAAAIREAGLAVEIEAAESTSAGLAAAIAKYFERHAGVKLQ